MLRVRCQAAADAGRRAALIYLYFHFNHSAKRQEEYREFLEFFDVAPLKILKHASTRWLSLEKCVNRFRQQWLALLSYFESHEDREQPGRVKRCADYLASVEMKAYFMLLSFILEPLNAFNTIFQTDATQIAIFIPEMNRLLRLFMAKFVLMRVIKSATDLTMVSFADRSVQLNDDILAAGMGMRTMLADSFQECASLLPCHCREDVEDLPISRHSAERSLCAESRPQVARHMKSNDGEEFDHSFPHYDR